MQNQFSKTPLFLSVMFFCIFLFVSLFLYRAIHNNNEKLIVKESEWNIESSKRNEIKVLNNSVATIEEERKKLETHFAQSSDIVPFLDAIEELAHQAGVKGEVTSVDLLKDHAGLGIGLKVLGTFNNLYRLLTLLENSPYELEVKDMDMHRDTTTSGAGSKNISAPNWGATFTIKLLSFTDKTPSLKQQEAH